MVIDGNKVRVEKKIPTTAPKLFKALAEGRMFMNCSADCHDFKNDFRVGGKYEANFAGYGWKNVGVYLEIVPNEKIVFTWGDEGSMEHFPKTTVSMWLKPMGDDTMLTIEHVGFKSKDEADAHNEGWTSGSNDLSDELTKGILRIGRGFDVSVEKLFEKCADPTFFFGAVTGGKKIAVTVKAGESFEFGEEGKSVKGKYLEVVPNQKISFSWDSTGCGGTPVKESTVTLEFESTDDGSYLSLTHEGLPTVESTQSHREGWNLITNQLQSELND